MERHPQLVERSRERRRVGSAGEDTHGLRGRESRTRRLTRGGASRPERGRGEGVPDANEKAASRRTPPIPGAGKERGRAGKQEEVLTQVPKQQVLAAAPHQTAGLGLQNEARHGSLPAFPLSTPTPPHSLCHTTLFSPLSATGGAIFPTLRSSSHHLPLPTYFGRKSGVGVAPPLAAGECPTPSSRPRPPVSSRASAREFPPTPGRRLRSTGGTSVGSRAPPRGRLLSPEVRRPVA
ncbi:uncharacterized protein LOC129006723 [Pongo pygmaeus]|uniref:uncharacterized protein LOC129006723 n=1 Tax=Pongo pygmaeus TaxID=9600 RepID=UPI0023E329DE|nr:uncharacterized protein LOC129006723 [Pongo pygmaeus]